MKQYCKFALIFLLLPLLSGQVAAQAPSNSTSIEAVRKFLTAQSSNREFWCTGLTSLEITNIELLARGEYNEQTRAAPVRVKIDGRCRGQGVFAGASNDFSGVGEFVIRRNDFSEWYASSSGIPRVTRSGQGAPPSYSAPSPPQQNNSQASAIPVPTQPVDPSAKAIMGPGFAGLRVGHFLSDAEKFFGTTLHETTFCGQKLPRRTLLQTGPDAEALVMMWDHQVVAFRVSTDRYRTIAGLGVGDPEEKVKQLYGRHSNFEARREVTDSHSTVPGVSLYYVGIGQPHAILAKTREGKVTSLIFGSNAHISQLADRCLDRQPQATSSPQGAAASPGQSPSQRWSYFCTDDPQGARYEVCSREVLSIEVPWRGRNLDSDRQRSPESDEFSRLLPPYKDKADVECRNRGFLRASEAYPLRAFMDSWYRMCRNFR